MSIVARCGKAGVDQRFKSRLLGTIHRSVLRRELSFITFQQGSDLDQQFQWLSVIMVGLRENQE